MKKTAYMNKERIIMREHVLNLVYIHAYTSSVRTFYAHNWENTNMN